MTVRVCDASVDTLADVGGLLQRPRPGRISHRIRDRDALGRRHPRRYALAAHRSVPRETECADDALSAVYLRPFYDAWLASEPAQRAEREQRLMCNAPRMEVIQETLVHLDKRHGGVEAYLRAGGMTADDIMRLRDRLRG